MIWNKVYIFQKKKRKKKMIKRCATAHCQLVTHHSFSTATSKCKSLTDETSNKSTYINTYFRHGCGFLIMFCRDEFKCDSTIDGSLEGRTNIQNLWLRNPLTNTVLYDRLPSYTVPIDPHIIQLKPTDITISENIMFQSDSTVIINLRVLYVTRTYPLATMLVTTQSQKICKH